MKGGCAVSKNLLIVEGDSDEIFIKKLSELVKADVEISSPICRIDEYKCLGGKDNLKFKLDEIKSDIEKGYFNKVGIILDADKVGIQERVSNINDAIKTITDDVALVEPNQWYRSDNLDVEISCHILNVDGYGELETLLRAIKSQDSPFADCLEAWRACLKNQKKEVNQKVFDKFWIDIYGRYDCCPEKSGDKCTSKLTLQKDYVWNFSHLALTDLRNYLAMFS